MVCSQLQINLRFVTEYGQFIAIVFGLIQPAESAILQSLSDPIGGWGWP
ncbi:MAG: hypothetical protein WA783_22020 [Phormidesmis sp.]